MDRGVPNPHINKYIQNYIDGTRVLFTKETIPVPKVAIDVPPDDPSLNLAPTEEQLAAQTAKELEQDAYIEAGLIMDDLVKKTMGFTDEQLVEFIEKEPDKYYDIVEDGLKKGIIPLQTSQTIPQKEIDDLLSKKLGIPVEDVATQPYFLTKKANEELEREGLLTRKRDNPYLKDTINDVIKGYRESKVDSEPEVAPSDEPITPAPETPVAANSTSKYSYLMAARQDDGKGIPQIDLRSEDKGQMKIGCMSACEYFATKADPVLAAQTIKPVQGTEITDPALQQKVASNATSYLSNGTNGLA